MHMISFPLIRLTNLFCFFSTKRHSWFIQNIHIRNEHLLIQLIITHSVRFVFWRIYCLSHWKFDPSEWRFGKCVWQTRFPSTQSFVVFPRFSWFRTSTYIKSSDWSFSRSVSFHKIVHSTTTFVDYEYYTILYIRLYFYSGVSSKWIRLYSFVTQWYFLRLKIAILKTFF